MSGALNHSPAEVIRQLLADLSLVSITENETWFCFVQLMADAPNQAVCVYDTDGIIHGRTHIDGDTQEHYGIQVKVRSELPRAGRLKAQAILRAFDTDVRRTAVTLDGSHYVVEAITRNGSVIPLGPEVGVSRRRQFTLNALVALYMIETGTGS